MTANRFPGTGLTTQPTTVEFKGKPTRVRWSRLKAEIFAPRKAFPIHSS